MSQSKPSTRSSNKGQRFDKNHNRVEEAVEEVPFITQIEEVISPVGRNDTTLVGTDEADDSHLDDQLIRTGFKNIDDNESEDNSGNKEENSENEEEEEEEEEEEDQRGVSFASENRTLTDEILVETGDITDTKWGPDRDPATISTHIHSISRVLYTLTTENLTRTLTQQRKPIVFLAQFQGCQYLKILHSVTQFTPQLGETS